MRTSAILTAVILFSCTSLGLAFDLNKTLKDAENKYLKRDKEPDEATKASGLKEALTVGTDNAVKLVGKPDGYFGNPAIKIPVPDKMHSAMDTLSRMGFKKQVEEFVLTMNRGAEKAAPKAVSIFGNAIKRMTIVDASKILLGGDNAATRYFEERTRGDLYNEFKPVISSCLDSVGATRVFKDIMNKAHSIRILDKEAVDLDDYVTNKALDGLFHMVSEEEKKIRTDPAARVTELLKTVFGRK